MTFADVPSCQLQDEFQNETIEIDLWETTPWHGESESVIESDDECAECAARVALIRAELVRRGILEN